MLAINALGFWISLLWIFFGIALIILVVANYFIKKFLLTPEKTIVDDTILAEKPLIPPMYEKESWFPQYIAEAKKVFANVKWSPFVYWVAGQHRGDYININSSGVRKSWMYFGHEQAELVIHVYGGSVGWGWGARDYYNIPSFIAKKLYEKGIKAKIYNYCQLGYVTTQGLLSFVKNLQKNHIPNLIICIDGLNDAFTAFQSNEVGIAQNESNRRREFNETLASKIQDSLQNLSIVKLFRGNSHVEKECTRTKALARECANLYIKNLHLYNTLAREYGIKCQFYWQPTIFDKNMRSSFEEYLYKKQQFWEYFYKQVYEEVSVIGKHLMVDLTGMFKDCSESIYIDPWHLCEAGNQKISELIAQNVIARVEEKSSVCEGQAVWQ